MTAMKTRSFGNHFDTGSVIKLSDHSEWITLKSGSGFVEGKLHRPEKGVQKLIIFEPGFPGDGSSRLEKLWLKDLLKNNFTVFAARHNGTIINGSYSDTYLNCIQKQEWAKQHSQTLLGKKEYYTVADWLIEPLIAMEALDMFDSIELVGHSFGGLAIFNSLIEFSKKYPSQASKIVRLVTLSGATGKVVGLNDPILKQWSDYLRRNATSKRVLVGDPDENLKILRAAYEKIHRESNLVPKTTEIICVNVENDELVSVQEGKDLIKTLGRGYLIVDKKEESDKESGRLAHDMNNLTSREFLKLVNIVWKPETEISYI